MLRIFIFLACLYRGAFADDEIKYTGRDNRDPLDNSVVLEKAAAEAVAQEEAVFHTENYVLSAVVWGSKRPQAIVNRRIVNIGEKLDGGEIVGIDKNGVHINFEGKEVLLAIR